MRTMKKHYRLAQLSKHEQEYLQMVLLNEMEVQAWFVVRCSAIMREELILVIQ